MAGEELVACGEVCGFGLVEAVEDVGLGNTGAEDVVLPIEAVGEPPEGDLAACSDGETCIDHAAVPASLVGETVGLVDDFDVEFRHGDVEAALPELLDEGGEGVGVGVGHDAAEDVVLEPHAVDRYVLSEEFVHESEERGGFAFEGAGCAVEEHFVEP